MARKTGRPARRGEEHKWAKFEDDLDRCIHCHLIRNWFFAWSGRVYWYWRRRERE